MTVTKVPLSLSEKKLLNRAFKVRLIIGLLFILPIMATTAYYCVQSLFKIGTDDFNLSNLLLIGAFIVCGYLFLKLAVPYYKLTVRNIRVKYKLIIETRVIDIKTDYVADIGQSYVIQTESPEPIVSTINILLNNSFSYKDLQVNMKIRIHCIENNTIDILLIEPVN